MQRSFENFKYARVGFFQTAVIRTVEVFVEFAQMIAPSSSQPYRQFRSHSMSGRRQRVFERNECFEHNIQIPNATECIGKLLESTLQLAPQLPFKTRCKIAERYTQSPRRYTHVVHRIYIA